MATNFKTYGKILITSEPYLKVINGEIISVQNIAALHPHKSDVSYVIALNSYLPKYEYIHFSNIFMLEEHKGVYKREL